MSGCRVTGKVRYRDRVAAEAALARIHGDSTRGQKKQREGLRVYRCRDCRGFHLGRARAALDGEASDD